MNQISENFNICIQESGNDLQTISLGIGKAHNWASRVVKEGRDLKAGDLLLLEKEFGFNSEFILKGKEPIFVGREGKE